ncbi:hypothetical protein FACS189490_10270 [Clostridia bacterium]|nr:hypothetical protein FACS189490_10270 [Clostridia bacterium]
MYDIDLTPYDYHYYENSNVVNLSPGLTVIDAQVFLDTFMAPFLMLATANQAIINDNITTLDDNFRQYADGIATAVTSAAGSINANSDYNALLVRTDISQLKGSVLALKDGITADLAAQGAKLDTLGGKLDTVSDKLDVLGELLTDNAEAEQLSLNNLSVLSQALLAILLLFLIFKVFCAVTNYIKSVFFSFL